MDVDVKVWIVFTNDTDYAPLKLLKRGFRHCFAVIKDGDVWLTIDPLLSRMEVRVHHDLPSDFDPVVHWNGLGDKVVSTRIKNAIPCPAPLMIFTCVEAIKRVLGIRSWRVVTPWGLWKHLRGCRDEL